MCVFVCFGFKLDSGTSYSRCFGSGAKWGFGLVYDCLDSWVAGLCCLLCLLTLSNLEICHGARASLLRDSGCRAADAGSSSLLNTFRRILTTLGFEKCSLYIR